MKPKVAFYWCAACGGCEEAVVDLAEKLLEAAAAVEIVFWPVALDFKRADVEALPDGSLAAAFINGAIRSAEQEEMARLLRRKARVVIAFGSCAQAGGVPGLANLYQRADLLETVYRRAPSMSGPGSPLPQLHYQEDGCRLELPELFDSVQALSQAIPVDYSIPGCPPTPELLAEAIAALLAGKLPEPGAVLAPDRALCQDCPRRDSKPEQLLITQFKRPHEVLIETDKCLLAQGLLCLGPATRAGCGARCIEGNMPCTGCFGPTSRVRDFGAKALSATASLVGSNDEAEILRILEKIPDPVGTFYRYNLPVSVLANARRPAGASQ
jgi:F420-non-reducing hydrogenase small subunit